MDKLKFNLTGRLLASLAIALTFVALIAAVPRVGAIENGGIGASPVNPDPNNPRSQSIFIYTPNLGEIVSDAIKINNTTNTSKTILVYAVDSIISSDGAFACAQAVEKKNDVGAWITLASNEVTIESGGSEIIPFSVSVPNQADVGEHDGCIVIQDKSDASNKTVGKGVVLSFRSAIRVVATIPGKTFKDIKFLSVLKTSNKTANLVTITPKLENSGNISSDIEVEGQLKTIFGRVVGRSGGSYPILPRATANWNFELAKPFWGGFYKVAAKATFDPNTTNRPGIKSGATKSISIGGSTIFIAPKPLAAAIEVVCLLVVIALGYWFINKKKRKVAVKKHWIGHRVEDGESIESLAKKHNISWKHLAKSNKLTSPYTLKSGTIIRVPGGNKPAAKVSRSASAKSR